MNDEDRQLRKNGIILQKISGRDRQKVQQGELNTLGHLVLLHLLEIQLGELVEPVRDLDDEEELVLETHLGMRFRIVRPQSRQLEKQSFPVMNIKRWSATETT